jgi:hypothetical protein
VAVNGYLDRMVPSDDLFLICGLGSDNDRLVKFLYSVGFVVGAHTLVSDAGDPPLRYTITVTLP